MNAAVVPLPSDGRVTNLPLLDATGVQIVVGSAVVLLFALFVIWVVGSVLAILPPKDWDR